MGFLDAPPIKTAFKSADGTVTPVWIVANESSIPPQVQDGDLILNLGNSADPFFGVPDLNTLFERAGEVQRHATRVGAVHGIDDFYSLVTSWMLGYDARTQALSHPVWARSAVTLTPGTLYLSRVESLHDITATKFVVETAGTAAATPTHVYFGLYEIIGNQRVLQAASADVAASALIANNAVYTPAFSSPANYVTARSHEWEVATLQVGGTGAVVWGANVGLSGQSVTKTLGAQTGLPSTITSSSLADSSTLVWAGVSE